MKLTCSPRRIGLLTLTSRQQACKTKQQALPVIDLVSLILQHVREVACRPARACGILHPSPWYLLDVVPRVLGVVIQAAIELACTHDCPGQ